MPPETSVAARTVCGCGGKRTFAADSGASCAIVQPAAARRCENSRRRMSCIDRRMCSNSSVGWTAAMRSIWALRDRLAPIVVSGLTFLAPAVSAQDVPTGAGQVPRFEPAPCPKLTGAGELAKASCGYLVVLANHSRPTGRRIRLLVAKYPARSPERRADPVVYLAGGPGDIAPLEVNGLIAADFIRDRDILVVSQRGTMFSEPALTCAPIDNFN